MTREDHVEAKRVADIAGDLLMDLRERLVAADTPPAVLKAEGDRQAHERIMEELRASRPDDAILSEEGSDSAERLAFERVWIVDPLDGTREFSEHPRDDWAVHVALAEAGRPVVGAVALPAAGLTLSTAEPTPTLGPIPDRPRMLVSRTRPPAAATLVADAMNAELVEMGSAGAKTMAVVRGLADIYVHSGGQYEWDNCAPAAVAASAGLHTSRIDGSDLVYNNADPYLPDLLVCRTELADQALDVLSRFEETTG
ncbi:MAG: 3'(2'),5'-bisphosphate nucleotidase CysQ [Acidimicrobiales bacterium]